MIWLAMQKLQTLYPISSLSILLRMSRQKHWLHAMTDTWMKTGGSIKAVVTTLS